MARGCRWAGLDGHVPLLWGGGDGCVRHERLVRRRQVDDDGGDEW